MNKLYSISVYWGGLDPTEAMAQFVETAIDASEDWIRFSGHQWYIYSPRAVYDLSNAIRSCLVRYPGSQCVVAALEPTAANGMAPEWIWKWLNEKMTKQMGDKFRSGA